MNSTSLLDVAGLTKVFPAGSGVFARGHITAVDDVSFDISTAEPTSITLVGESGSGKTTIARIILGLEEPTAGEIRYKGKPIHHMSRQEWKAYWTEVQGVFQDPYGIYNPFYTIDRALEKPIQKFGLASSKAEARERIEEALRAADLRPEDILGRYPHQLSGGERQRVLLSRLYLMKPQLIIADEPVSMIDVSLRASFLNILLRFKREYGMSCLFITHNLATAYYLGGQIIVLCQGQIAEMGDMDAVVHNPMHPYTQVLIDSVPAPDPRNRWQDNLDMEFGEMRRSGAGGKGCMYCDRCPSVTDVCREHRPKMIDVGESHQVACHLYDPE